MCFNSLPWCPRLITLITNTIPITGLWRLSALIWALYSHRGLHLFSSELLIVVICTSGETHELLSPIICASFQGKYVHSDLIILCNSFLVETDALYSLSIVCASLPQIPYALKPPRLVSSPFR